MSERTYLAVTLVGTDQTGLRVVWVELSVQLDSRDTVERQNFDKVPTLRSEDYT